MKDQITHPPDNTDHSVAKQKFRITNWSTYNKALINRGSLTFWLDDGAIQAWYESATPSSRGRPQRYVFVTAYDNAKKSGKSTYTITGNSCTYTQSFDEPLNGFRIKSTYGPSVAEFIENK